MYAVAPPPLCNHPSCRPSLLLTTVWLTSSALHRRRHCCHAKLPRSDAASTTSTYTLMQCHQHIYPQRRALTAGTVSTTQSYLQAYTQRRSITSRCVNKVLIVYVITRSCTYRKCLHISCEHVADSQMQSHGQSWKGLMTSVCAISR